jgi:hypothetical protein
MKKVPLAKVRVGQTYEFNCVSNFGAGSGSQSWWSMLGPVKEVNAEFVRVFSQPGVNKQSVKIYVNAIQSVYQYQTVPKQISKKVFEKVGSR